MKKLYLFFIMLLLISGSSWGQDYEPLVVTSGFNEDIIVDNSLVANFTTIAVDETNFYANSTFMSSTYQSITPSDGIVYVNTNVIGGTGDGSSWDNAIKELADALKWANQNKAQFTTAKPLKIYIAKGQYKPKYSPIDGDNFTDTPIEPRDKTFLMVDNVELYGGFDPDNGIKTITDKRIIPDGKNEAPNGTILSGDLGIENDNKDNAFHVVISNSMIKLDGITIESGNANGSGVIKINETDVIRSYGGGINISYNKDGVIIKNTSVNNNAAMTVGGGIYITNNPLTSNVVRFEHSQVNYNTSNSGGGIYFSRVPKAYNITFHSSQVNNNTAINEGGGIYSYGSSMKMFNTRIDNNKAKKGGGIYVGYSDVSLINSSVSKNIVTAPKSEYFVCSAIYTMHTVDLKLINSNVYENIGHNTICFQSGGANKLTVYNSIVHNNKETNGNFARWEINSGHATPPKKDIQNNWIQGDNNNFTPSFTDPDNGDYSLQPDSDLIDKGKNELYSFIIDENGNAVEKLNIINDKDLGGETRLVNRTIDIGAYERQLSIPKVIAINRIGDEVVLASTNSIAYEVKFSEAVTGVDAADFVLTPTGTTNGIVSNLLGNGDTYTINVESLSGKGTIRLDLKNTGTGIISAYQVPIDTGFTTGQTFTIDRDVPKTTNVTVPINGTYKKGDVLIFKVKFDEVVNVKTKPYLELTIGAKKVKADYSTGDGTTELTFNYTVQASDLDIDGIEVANKIVLNSGDKITDTVANDAILTLNGIPSTNGIIIIGEEADISITFSVSQPVIKYNETVDFIITVVNKGPDDATNVDVSIILPPELQFENATSSQGTYDSSIGKWKIGKLANGLSQTLKLIVKAKSIDTYNILANVTSDLIDLDLANNSAKTNLTVDKASIIGITFNDETFTYDGSSKSIRISGVLPAEAKVSYVGNGKTDAGTYNVTATIDGGNNYIDQILSAKLIIDKASIIGITFNDETFIYDGSSKSIEISGTLPKGVIATYVGNGRTDAGRYNVTATIDGGNNYTSFQPLSANLIIDKASITGITFNDETFTYDGSPKSIEISGTLPKGVIATYVGNGKTEAGRYNVTATIDGGNNYTSFQPLSANLIIDKATITGITLNDRTFIYDGSSKSIEISGALPKGVIATYVGNGKTEAGRYNVTATIDGGNNYTSFQPLSANLIIDKATITGITLNDRTFIYDGSPKSIEISGTLPKGVIATYVGNGRTDAGRYNVTATIDGGNNYTSFQSLSANLIIDKATQAIIWNQNLVVGCDVENEIQLTAKSSSGLPIVYHSSNESIVKVIGDKVELTGVGFVEITASQQGNNNFSSANSIAKKLNTRSKGMVKQKWDKVLTFDNSSNQFVKWQWYKDGVRLNGATKQFYESLQPLSGVYYVVATDLYNNQLETCPITIVANVKTGGIKVVPNPVRQGTMFDVVANYTLTELIGAELIITDLTGRKFVEMKNVRPTTKLQAPLVANVYVINLFLSDGRRASANMLVK